MKSMRRESPHRKTPPVATRTSPRRELSKAPNHLSPDLSIAVASQEEDFDQNTQSYAHSEQNDSLPTARDPHTGENEPSESERMRFLSLIDEVYSLLPEDKFPRPPEQEITGRRPRSSIQMEQTKIPRKSISLPQSEVVTETLACITDHLGKSSITENWCPQTKDISSLASLRFYQSHSEKFPTSSASHLDEDASRLGLNLKGNCNFPVKTLESYEKHSRDLVRMLSHADIFSYAAYKCLHQETLDPRFLNRLLDSLSITIKDSIGVASILSVALQQARRDAAIQAATRSLTDLAKNDLRKVPVTGKFLFGGQIEEIYKKNMEAHRDKLVDKAVLQQTKSQPSSTSSRKKRRQLIRKSTPSKTKSTSGTTTKPDPPSNRGTRSGQSFRGSSFRGRGAPSRRGASSAKKL